MNKCFEIDKDGNVHQGIRVDVFNALSDDIMRPSIVVGGKGIGNSFGVIPIYKPKDTKEIVQYTDSRNRVYGLWLDYDNDKPYAEFNKAPTSPYGFGSSNAIVAFRTHNRCIGIESYTARNEIITCLDEMCRLQYVGKARSMPRQCRECGGKVKSTFRPFPGIILTDGKACDDGDAQTGTEIVAQIPMGYAFRVAITIGEDKKPIECYYQFNGGDIESLGMFQEDKHGNIRKVKPKGD